MGENGRPKTPIHHEVGIPIKRLTNLRNRKGRKIAEMKCTKITLKGQALLWAIDAGLIKRKHRGYPMEAFNKFWALLLPYLKEVQDINEVVSDECNEAAEKEHE